MIYSEKSDSLLEFEKLLYAVKLIGERVLHNLDQIPSGLEFEYLVYKWMCEASIRTNFEGKITQTSDRDFPDIIAQEIYGVEVKLTKGDKWTSIGNSILETNRIESVKYIYIMFGKIGGSPEIKYKPYNKCISGIAVTHSPRYKVDMNLGSTFFDELGVSYNDFRNSSEKIDTVKSFYRKDSEHLWWIDQDKGVDMIMKEFGKLSKDDKMLILTDSFVAYPEIFSSDYKGVNNMLTNMGITCNNTRDIFSAGGQRNIDGEMVSAVLGRFHDNLSVIKDQIINKEKWLEKIIDKRDVAILSDWLS